MILIYNRRPADIDIDVDDRDIPVVACDRKTGLVVDYFQCAGDGELVLEDMGEQAIIDQCNGDHNNGVYSWYWASQLEDERCEA